MNEPVLTLEDRRNHVWVKLRKHLEERRETLRRKNDADLDERRTARLRGQIAEITTLLALAEDQPTILQDTFVE